MYTMAGPLVIASPIMFVIYQSDMFEGEVCKFYELAGGDNDQQECLENYFTDPSKYIKASGFRYYALLMALIVPVCFQFIELFNN